MWFHKKTSKQVFHSNNHKCVEKQVVENLFSFQKWQELCWKSKSNVYVTLDEFFLKNTPKIIQNIPKKRTFSCFKLSPRYVLSPHQKKCLYPPTIRRNLQIYDWFMINILIIKDKKINTPKIITNKLFKTIVI